MGAVNHLKTGQMDLYLNIIQYVCVHQMFRAFERYISDPKVSQVSMQSIFDTSKPLIYICTPDQFDFTAAANMGYNGHQFYLTGNRN